MKKTNKENPITTFRKLNEARKGTIMKSLKKAQDGIGVNDTMNDDMINKAGSTGGYKTPTPTWSAKDAASMATAFANSNLGANAERMNNINRGDYSNGAAREARNDALNNYQRQVGTQQENLMKQEMINRMNTTPKTGIPPSNEELNYIKLRQEAINNKGAKNGGIMKKGGTHKMPNGKIMLNSKMKTGGVVKKKFDDGGLTGKQNRLARQEKRVYNKYTDAKTSGNTKKSSRLYDRLMDKQTKSIKAGVNVQYKTGGTTKATKFAALAPPYNKATIADRIVGAKKNASKKK